MDILYPRCAGLDVHAATVVACVRVADGAKVGYDHRTVSTTTRGLLELAEWLMAHHVTHVAMEATGVYWKPVWHVLEEHVTLILANAMHIRNIPGRKSDKNDATGIADLLAVGLIRSSFVPPSQIQVLRDLTRTRKQLVREAARHTQRLQKTLEDANCKLTEVISNLLGESGRAILHAMIAGESNPERLADLASSRIQATRAQLVAALDGRVTAHHRFLLTLHLTQITAIETAVADVEQRIQELADAGVDEERLLAAHDERPQPEADTIPLVGRRALLPQRLRHDAEHGAAVETEGAVRQRNQLELAELHSFQLPASSSQLSALSRFQRLLRELHEHAMRARRVNERDQRAVRARSRLAVDQPNAP